MIKSILKNEPNDDENNKPPPPSTPSINVQEQAARTLRDRRGALRVVEMFMSLEKFDSENQLAASTASVLTQRNTKTRAKREFNWKVWVAVVFERNQTQVQIENISEIV